ncbi:MAG: potassium channel protein [Ruminococcaceae bacterium]|nr:potassium channel protein [Oscillospiraceae bacterium]
MVTKNTKNESFREKLARVVEIGASDDWLSRGYDFYITGAIVVNLIVALLLTYEELSAWGGFLHALEDITVFCFLVDYVLRLIAARYIYRKGTEAKSIAAYALSFSGVVDLLSFLPNYLPFFFPAGAIAFRMFRVVRIFRLFRITAYYDSLNAIAEVITGKKQQLLSSVFIVLVLMVGSSLCMYSVEHDAQPEVFRNAFSGIWWAVSTLLTVGYGDIYPITTLGKLLGIFISFLGVGIVAIPTGIISAGFVEQYARVQSTATIAREQDIHFIKFRLESEDAWVGRSVLDLKLPRGVIVTAVHRGGEVIVPRGDVVLAAEDTVVLGAEPLRGSVPLSLKEVVLMEKNPWNGQCIRDLDISRQTVIVLVKRGSRVIIPNGTTRLRAGDTLLLHTKVPISGSTKIQI